jgi:anti-sigma B factor antagonist
MPSRPSRSWFDVQQVGTVTVVRFTCAAIRDQVMVQALGEELLKLAFGRPERPCLLLNFRDVTYLSSAMLGKLIGLQKQAQAAGGRLALCELDQNLCAVFEVSQLDKRFAIYADETEALGTFA